MDVLASRILLERRIASKVSCRGGIVMETSCVMSRIGGTLLGNGDNFSVRKGKVVEEEVHTYHLGWRFSA